MLGCWRVNGMATTLVQEISIYDTHIYTVHAIFSKLQVAFFFHLLAGFATYT